MANSSLIRTARLRRATPVLVCQKCLSRVDDGHGFKRRLKSGLKQRSDALAVKAPRVVLTKCLGICPKRAVVVASASTLGRGEYLLLTDRDGIAEAADVLMPEPSRPFSV